MSHGWEVRLSNAAEKDFVTIIAWTRDQFGRAQAEQYAGTLAVALESLGDGPEILGCKGRDDIAPGLFSLHVARSGHKGRHVVIFRISRSGDRPTIDVLRLLHDSMDPQRHLDMRD